MGTLANATAAITSVIRRRIVFIGVRGKAHRGGPLGAQDNSNQVGELMAMLFPVPPVSSRHARLLQTGRMGRSWKTAVSTRKRRIIPNIGPENSHPTLPMLRHRLKLLRHENAEDRVAHLRVNRWNLLLTENARGGRKGCLSFRLRR
jgi:hypothetical protein